VVVATVVVVLGIAQPGRGLPQWAPLCVGVAGLKVVNELGSVEGHVV